MKQALEAIRLNCVEELQNAHDMQTLENIRVKFLGKKGELTAILKQMGKLSAEERPVIGQLANEIRSYMEEQISTRSAQLKNELQAQKLKEEKLDVTLPGKASPMGKKHPLNIVLDEIQEIFLGMGFSVATGPEVELDYYNFEALNIPKDHPAPMNLYHRIHADPVDHGALIRISPGYSPVQGRLHTCYSPVRRSPPGVATRAAPDALINVSLTFMGDSLT